MKDSLMSQSTLTLSTPDLPGKSLWSNGDTTHMPTTNKAGNYTAFNQDSRGCWKAATRYRIQLENDSPPVFLRHSILPSPCIGTELRLPWYPDNDIIASQNWNGKKYLYPQTEGKYVIEKTKKGPYKWSCDRSDQAMNAGDYNYPYPLAQMGSIDSCSGKANFYPYFYNWQFSAYPSYADQKETFISGCRPRMSNKGMKYLCTQIPHLIKFTLVVTSKV
ncbi:MAG: hypothetical protein IPP37_08245 [Saprospiraceae bacterium]|nr:hypothetical protein [Saprospiraceae bacterium]